MGLESLWVNRNLEKNGGFETLWVILPQAMGLSIWKAPVWVPSGTLEEWRARLIGFATNYASLVLVHLEEIQEQSGEFTYVD